MRKHLAALAVGLAALAAGAEPPLVEFTDPHPGIEVRPLSGDQTVTVRYGALDPRTFHAELGDLVVSDRFRPEPGTSETVTLPFIGGRNQLVIEASSPDGLVHLRLDRTISFARMPGDEHATERLRSAPELREALWQERTAPAPAPASGPAAAPSSAPPP
jgi:hypothetical protein